MARGVVSGHPTRVAHYYFDTRDNDQIIYDDIGIELADICAVRTLAAESLGELAAEVLPCSNERCLSVDVRDAHSEPVLTVELTFRARIMNKA